MKNKKSKKLRNKNIYKSTVPKGFVSLHTVIILLTSILAITISDGNNITANVIFEDSTSFKSTFSITEVNNFNELNQLNEGWYSIRNGHVFYLDKFDSYIPLYIKANNPPNLNGLFVIDSDGNIEFEENDLELIEKTKVDYEETNKITGEVTGLESVTGFQVIRFKNEGTEPVFFDSEGDSCQQSESDCNIRVNPNQALTCIGGCHVVPIQGTTSGTGSSSPQTSQILKPQTVVTINEKDHLVQVETIDNDVKITIIGSDERTQTYSYPSYQVNPSTIDWQSYGVGTNAFPIRGGGLRIIVDSTVTDTFPDRTVRTTFTGGQPTEIQTTTNPGTPEVQTTLEEIRTDGSKKTTTSTSGVTQSVTFAGSNGETLTLTGESYESLGDNGDRILRIAAQEGFTNPEVSEGKLQDGSKTLELAGSDVILRENNRIISSTNTNGITKRYSGDVQINSDGEIDLNSGSTETTYNPDGTLTVRMKLEDSTTTYDNVRIVNDPESPFNGLYQFKSEGKTYYLDGGTVYSEVNGEKVKHDGSSISSEQADVIGSSIDDQRESKGLPSRRKEASQRFFANLERVFTEFRGLSYISSIFIGDDELLKWRDNVDRAFATAYLGTEYWSSAICDVKLDGEQVGVAYAETPSGIAQVGAHIEATRTQPIVNTTGHTTYIYKITFSVRNGDFDKDPRAPERMDINAIIKGDARNVILFKRDINISRGGTFGRTGTTAIVKESETLYSQVCLTFNKIPLRWKIDREEDGKYILCNNIQESSGDPTSFESQTTTATTGTDAELNDF